MPELLTMFNDPGIIKYLEQEFSICCNEGTAEEWKRILSQRIHQLMLNDRDVLIAILYRVDVSESKLRQLLQEKKGREAARAIAELVIERQLQKIKSRSTSPKNSTDIDENERW